MKCLFDFSRRNSECSRLNRVLPDSAAVHPDGRSTLGAESFMEPRERTARCSHHSLRQCVVQEGFLCLSFQL